MAANENIGAVSVLIGGDYSPLVAAFGQAQNVARQAGSAVANAFNQGAGNAAGLVDQFGRSISSAGAETAKTSAETAALNAQIAALTARVNELANALARKAAAAHAGVTEIQATSGALRVLEGSGGIRAAERFLTMIPGLGAALTNAFPVVGAIALLEVIHRMATEIAKFYTEAQQGPERVRGAFAELNAGLQTANDELQLANDKLDNQIAKLTGQHENVLKEMIDEAALAADRLASKLDNAIKGLIDLQKKEQVGFFEGLFTNQGVSTDFAKKLGGASGQGGERAEIRAIEETARARIAAAQQEGDLDAANGAREQARIALQGKYNELIRQAAFELGVLNNAQASRTFIDADQTKNIELVTGLLSNLKAQARGVDLEFSNTSKQQEVTALRGQDTPQGDPAGVAEIKAQEAAVARRAEISRKLVEITSSEQRQSAQVTIEGIENVEARKQAADLADIAQARSRQALIIAIAKQQRDEQIALIPQLAAKEKIGKSPEEQAAIDIEASQKVAEAEKAFLEARVAATANTVQKVNKSNQDAAEWQRRLLEESDRFLEEQANKEIQRAERVRQAQTRIAEINAKGAGQQAELGAASDKLALERQYGIQVTHTKQQEIDYLKQIAAIEERGRQSNIASVQKELAAAQAGAKDPTLSQEARNEQAVKAEELRARVAQLQQQSSNANFAAQTKVLETIQKQNDALQAQKTILDALVNWQEITLGTVSNELAGVLVGLPQKVGDSLAESIFRSPRKGQSKAGEIGEGLVKTGESVGRDIAGKLLTTAIEKLIVQLVGQAAINALQSSVQAANTAAVTALAASNTGLIIADTALVTSNAALIAALTANTTATLVQVGLLGFADGGSPPIGVPSMVGERGPELFIPRQAGVVVPNHMLKGYADGGGLQYLPSSTGAAGVSSVMHTVNFSGDMHFHNLNNPREMAQAMVREVPRVLKSRGAGWSPYS